jgi:hypothetical protein
MGPRRPGFDRERIVTSEARRAGVGGRGVEFEKPLAILLDALAEERGLSLIGRVAASSLVRSLVRQRFEMDVCWGREPAILEQPVVAPLVVIGLPRSGTTLLQFLLAADPGNRALLHWEATRPCPPPETATYATDPRIRAVERSFRVVDYLAPDARSIHPLAADRPTECVTLLARSFASLEFAATYGVEAHLEWFLGADLGPHYVDLRRQLQLLQWRHGGGRWMLKCPAHLFALDALLDAFPDARIVHLHRDPATALASYCSLVSVLHRVSHDAVDPDAIGRTWAPVWAEGLRRAITVRASLPATSVFDLRYGELVADPIGSVARLYGHFDLELPDGARARMREVLAGQLGHAGGSHRYTCEQFGLDADAERARNDDYISQYDVDPEG